MTQKYVNAGYDTHWARTNQGWTKGIADEIPEVEALIRFQSYDPRNVKIDERKFRQEYSYAVDSNVFDFELIAGNPESALDQPYSVVITEKIAQKYFGDEEPMLKTVDIAPLDGAFFKTHVVTGVMKDLPHNTHLPVNMLTTINGADQRKGWAYTYLLVKPGTSPSILDEKIAKFRDTNCSWEGCGDMNLPLQNLSDIHLTSNLAREITQNGDLFYIYIFMAVGLFVLIVAIINFMNLSAARSLERAKEVGIRKVLGSHKNQLVVYFLFESIMFAFLACLFSFVIIQITLPYFNYITGIKLELNLYFTLLILLVFSLITGICAGFYPAFVLSYSGIKSLI